MAHTDRGQRAARVKEARSAAKRARQAGREGDWEAADGALRAWLSARLERPGGSLSPNDAASVLVDAGAPGGLATDLAALIGSIEEMRYGGGSAGDLAEDIGDWIDRAAAEWRS